MESSFSVEEYLGHLHLALQASSKVLVVDVRKGRDQIEYIYTALENTNADIDEEFDTFIQSDGFDNVLEADEVSQVIDKCNQDKETRICQDITSEELSKLIMEIEDLVEAEAVNGPTIPLIFNAQGELQAMPETKESTITQTMVNDHPRLPSELNPVAERCPVLATVPPHQSSSAVFPRGVQYPLNPMPLLYCNPCKAVFSSSSTYNSHMKMHQMNIRIANEALSQVGKQTIPKSLRALRVA